MLRPDFKSDNAEDETAARVTPAVLVGLAQDRVRDRLRGGGCPSDGFDNGAS